MLDAGIDYDEVDQAFAGYVYGVSSNLPDFWLPVQSGNSDFVYQISRLRFGIGLDVRTTCAVRSRLDLHPSHQRQQQVSAEENSLRASAAVLTAICALQLLHWFFGTLAGTSGSRVWYQRLRDGARIREG